MGRVDEWEKQAKKSQKFQYWKKISSFNWKLKLESRLGNKIQKKNIKAVISNRTNQHLTGLKTRYEK